MIVVNDETLGDEFEALTFVQALRGRGVSIKVIVSDNASATWRHLAANYYEIVTFNPVDGLEFVQKITYILASNSNNMRLNIERTQPHEYKLQRGQIGDIQFDLLTGILKIAEERADDLSPKEARIFDVLAGSANQCVSRAMLASAVWGDVFVSERTLDTHISRLRRKISSSSECAIESVYGKGYSLVIQL